MKYSEVKDKLEGFFNIDEAATNNIRALFEGGIHPDNFKSVQKWEQQCYNELPYDDKFMCALNEIIGGFGTEAIRLEGHWDSYYGDIVAEYINTGDTYSATIVHDVRDDAEEDWDFTTWGDWYEKHIMPLLDYYRSDEFWEKFQELQDGRVKYDSTFINPLEEIMELCPYFNEPTKYFVQYLKEEAEMRDIELCVWLRKDEYGHINRRTSWIFIK